MTPSIADIERKYIRGREAYKELKELVVGADLSPIAIDLFYITQVDAFAKDNKYSDELDQAFEYLINRGYFGGKDRYVPDIVLDEDSTLDEKIG